MFLTPSQTDCVLCAMSNSFKSRPEVQPALRVAERMTSQIEAAKYDEATNAETLELLERPRDEVLEVLRAYDNLRDYIRYAAKEAQATKQWSKEEVQLHRIAQDTHRSSHSQNWQECTIKNKNLGPEEVGRLKGVSVEETSACVLTLLGIVIFIAHMINIKTDPAVNYRYPEALLMSLYPASLVVNACLYIRGRCFKFLEPNVEKPWREEHLRCVKENIRAWVQRNRMRILGREKLEKTIIRHQESFAWYIVSAGSDSKFRGVEYSRRRNGAIVVMIFWLHYACGALVHLVVYEWMEPEDPDKLLWII
jgi:hypothetical protein